LVNHDKYNVLRTKWLTGRREHFTHGVVVLKALVLPQAEY